MKLLLRIEELFMMGLGIYLFSLLPYAWWWFLVLLLVPDIGMLGYLFSNKTGALLYNIFHHKGVAIAVYLLGIYFESPITQLIGVMLFSHSSFDRIVGYGLKFDKGFKYTHLGEIGNNNNG